MTKVAGGREPGDDTEITSYALDRWDRAARLCAIKLIDAMPAVAPLVWLILRR